MFDTPRDSGNEPMRITSLVNDVARHGDFARRVKHDARRIQLFKLIGSLIRTARLDRGAILYTIIECCRRRSIDPHTYLRDALTRWPRMTNHQIPAVTPQAWAKSLRTAAKAA